MLEILKVARLHPGFVYIDASRTRLNLKQLMLLYATIATRRRAISTAIATDGDSMEQGRAELARLQSQRWTPRSVERSNWCDIDANIDADVNVGVDEVEGRDGSEMNGEDGADGGARGSDPMGS